jgi:hypothetical protein
MLRAVAIASLLGCGATTSVHDPRSALVIVEGDVVDSQSGEKLVAASIVFTRADVEKPEVALTDERGHYEMRLEPVHWQLDINYGPAAMHDAIDVPAGRDRFSHRVSIDHRLLLASNPDNRMCPGWSAADTSRHNRGPQPLVDDVVHAVLARIATNPGTFNDHGQLGQEPFRVVLELDVPPRRALTAAALPRPGPFIATTREELRREADTRGIEVSFIRFTGVEIYGACAMVGVGTEMFQPRRESVQACCCAQEQIYEEHDGTWKFSRSLGDDPCG